MDRLAGHSAGLLAEQIEGRRGDFVRFDVAAQRRFLRGVFAQLVEARYARGTERAQRAGAEAVDADIPSAEIPGQIADAVFEGRLADAHHVVAGHDLLAAEVAYG